MTALFKSARKLTCAGYPLVRTKGPSQMNPASDCKSVLSRSLAIIALFATSTVSTYAQTNWTGQFSSNWFLSGNWDASFPRQTTDGNINTVTPNSTMIADPGASARNLSVGQNGTGTLTIQNGGTLADSFGTVGDLPGGVGTVTVTGAGANWSNAGGIVVGGLGTGTLTVQDGGRLNGGGGSIGLSAGSTGTVTVTGPGSRWINGFSGGLNIGSFGTGTLTIANGGVVINSTNFTANIGNGASGQGSVTVTGAGSTWSNSSGVNIGNLGTGTLTIADGGIVTGPIVIATRAGATGTLNIGAAAGNPATAPGTLTTLSLAFGAGSGTLNFNHTSANYVFAPAISGNGTVNVLAGSTTLTGANSYSGATNVNAGSLGAGAPSTFSPNSAVMVASGGTLDLKGFSQTAIQRRQCRLGEPGHGHCAGHGLDDDPLHGHRRNDRDEHPSGGRRFAVRQASHQRRQRDRQFGAAHHQCGRPRRRDGSRWHRGGAGDQRRHDGARCLCARWRSARWGLRLSLVSRRRLRRPQRLVPALGLRRPAGTAGHSAGHSTGHSSGHSRQSFHRSLLQSLHRSCPQS